MRASSRATWLGPRVATRWPGLAFKAALSLGAAMPVTGALAASWQTIVNNAVVAPQSTPPAATPYFFSYNQPAVNWAGQVVFRARAKPLTSTGAGGGEPTQGVYTRDISSANTPVKVVADNQGTVVPSPNTTGATFIEFPSTPRSAAASPMVAFRGQSQGVVTLPDGTKVGTSGVYASPRGTLVTGASQLGDVPGYAYFEVPGAVPGTGFDQFPGSPSPLRNRFVVFKGNYTENNVSKTGVFYRDLLTAKGKAAVQLVAETGMPIPGSSGAVFGSTAPPSAATDPSSGADKVVFTGFDVEEAPTAGGIYIEVMGQPATLAPIVSLNDPVPGVPGATFTGFGEGLSYTGTRVSFWASWGSETMTVHKTCPTDGNKDLIAYCLKQYPNGVDLTESVNQGIFTANTQTNKFHLVARTQAPDGFTDFLYWTYSGKPPGSSGGGDAEPPRWRSSSFTAVTNAAVAFKGQKGSVDGLYVHSMKTNVVLTVLDTTMDGQSVDPMAPSGSTISSIGLERDGFRGKWLTISAGMENATTAETWGGLYGHNCGAGCATW